MFSGLDNGAGVSEQAQTADGRHRVHPKALFRGCRPNTIGIDHTISSDFDSAFFILADEKLLGVYWDVCREVLANSWPVKIVSAHNGIYFALLSEVTACGMNAKLTGLKDTMTFAKLAA